MNNEEVFNAIKEKIMLIKDIDDNQVSYHSTFLDLYFDSLDYVEIQIFILDEYNIHISDELFIGNNIGSIKQLIEYIVLNLE